MKGRKGFTLIELLVVIAIIAILAAILFPVFARAKRQAQTSTCIANMNQIGKALKQYVTEWDQTYPTNRNSTNGTLGPLVAEVRLSQVGLDPATNQPYKKQYGVAWVESLYKYTEPITGRDDNSSVWKCPAANLALGAGANSTAAASAEVTYLMNFNLLEQPESIIRDGTKVMLMRESDRLQNSSARGGASGTGGYTQVLSSTGPQPTAPFLTPIDVLMVSSPGGANCTEKLHGQGSVILFSDGHTKAFDSTEFYSGTDKQGKPVVDNTYGVWASARKNVFVTP